ncbi:MAG: HlyD family efflux transporter periplasmic adaptor subunit [Planctomycetes bacterium]|nr:HlyD family efflux transporter periplasmic adaptor subunit [Planctomycetota bacterium]
MRTAVILGVIVLIVSIVGTVWLRDFQSASINAHAKNSESDRPEKVVCWGYLDGESGVAKLYPRQFGDVTDVLPENTHVDTPGKVLLQVNDALARLDVKRAEADVTAAEKQLAEARKLPDLYKLQAEQQEALIRSIGHERSNLEQKRDREIRSLPDPESKLAETIKKLYTEGLAQLDEKKKAEEAKLKQIKLQDADLKIDQAKADLDAKKARHLQATEMLKHFQIVAPSAGTLLRVNVRKGEVLGPNPMAPALEFLPDGAVVVKAEVWQEWGRFVQEQQDVEIEDDTFKGEVWKGKVKSKAKWYAQVRSPVIEPFRYNDVRTLDCIISLTNADRSKLIIGQRVRAKIKIN